MDPSAPVPVPPASLVVSSADRYDDGAPPGARERNRRGEGGRLRADILRAAAAILDEAGDEQAVTLRAVARRVGITAPSIYRHFADRHALLLVLVEGAFAELTEELESARAGAGSDPAARLRAVCAAYLNFAGTRPQRYRVMFGGLWSAAEALAHEVITRPEVAALGQLALGVLVTSLRDCVAARRSTSTDPLADAVALWVALHGLSHQRAVTQAFTWPEDITERLVEPLAHLRSVTGPASPSDVQG